MADSQAGPSASIRSKTDFCSNDIFSQVSKHIGKDVKKLGRALGIDEAAMDRIEIDEGKWGIDQIAFKTLETWRILQGDQATEEKLIGILEDIERFDIVRKIWPKVLPKKPASRKETSYLTLPPLKLEQLQENLRREYWKFQMKGLPWMKNLCLSLEDHFVDLEMINADKSTQQIELNHIFQFTDSRWTQHRILVEGDAGFGKSTIAAKLCYDYSSRADYLEQFDIVLFSSLRDFNYSNLEEMLESAADISENQQPEFFKLIKSKSTLLILDGFDELSKENGSPILDLIRGKKLPNITLLVTSRPGRFESDELGKLFSIGSRRDAGYDFTKHWDKRIKIVGISEKRQDEFIQKHLSNFSSHQKEYARAQMSRMKESDVLTPEFLRCPLFILMIVLLLTDDKTDLQHLTTKTQLYKGVFNFVMQRFVTKLDAAFTETVDLFTPVNVSQSYFDLLKQFGEFSLSAIKDNKLSFSREYILGLNSKRNEQILEMGFLIHEISLKGLKKREYYEAVHKSLLEFAAAFYLWIVFVAGPSEEWLNIICSVRPIFPIARSSLLFPSLIGLMGNDASALLDALRPFAAEYSSMFDSLIPTIAEAEMAVNVNNSVSQFLPIRWWTHWFNSDISADVLPPEIMVEGTKADKIKWIDWVSWHTAHFHGNIKVDKLMLYVGKQFVTHTELNRIECISLLCYLYEGCKWKDFLHLVSFIRFQQISFNFEDASEFLPSIYEAVKTGKLKDAKIDYVRCVIYEDEKSLIDMMAELAKMDRVRALEIHLSLLPSQKQLDSLFTSISKSSRLTTFILFYEQQTPLLTVNLAQLCNGGQKSYKWLWIENATLECIQPMQNQNLQIELLQLSNILSTSSTATIFNSYRVVAYGGPLEVVPNDKYELIVELDITINTTFFSGQLFTQLDQVRKLQILILEMTSFNYQPKTTVDEWLLKYVKCWPFLKGIQIYSIERNLPLAKEIVKGITSYLEKKSVVSSSIQSETSLAVHTNTEFHQLHLEYLALHVYLEPDLNNTSESDKSNILDFVSLLSSLKQSVIKKELPRLDIVFRDRFSYCIAKSKPNGFSSFNEMFPLSEGFVVRHDFWGMREDDSIEGRTQWDTWSELNRFSVSC